MDDPFSIDVLRKATIREKLEVAEQLRQMITTAVEKNGGHLAASLGAVELAIALHLEFDSPREPIVWDVGHQAYAHKLLTGRANDFMRLRHWGGPSGFLSRNESPHDVFGAGHSSTSFSASLGLSLRSEARTEENPAWTVAVMGDGAMTSGLAWEAVLNAQDERYGPLLWVLNDNGMSISENVGALHTLLQHNGITPLFRQLGFEAYGPCDGNDLVRLGETLRQIHRSEKSSSARIFLHVKTQKGKKGEVRGSEYVGPFPVDTRGATLQ